VIPPGGVIPLHHHGGTQVAYIRSGEVDRRAALGAPPCGQSRQEKIVIFLSTLLKHGAPPSTPG
jgi:hypothetical protein